MLENYEKTRAGVIFLFRLLWLFFIRQQILDVIIILWLCLITILFYGVVLSVIIECGIINVLDPNERGEGLYFFAFEIASNKYQPIPIENDE